MNILLITHSYWPEHSPPQRRWQALIRHLHPYGWDITVIAPVAHYSHGPDYSRRTRNAAVGPLGESIRRVPYMTGRDNRISKVADQLFTAVGSLMRGLAATRPDVVIVTAPALPLMAVGWLIATIRRVPLVLEMRDAWPELITDSEAVWGLMRVAVNRCVESIQNHANVVVTVTDGFAQMLRERGVRHVITIRNGVQLGSTPYLSPVPYRERLEVLYLGNHGESQGLERLIDAAALVGPVMRLTLVGQGSRKTALMAYAACHGAPVRFLDPVFREEVFAHYEQADSLVISLRDDWKSFDVTVPSKTYEVMSVGRHITAVVKGEAAQVLHDAGTGHIVSGEAAHIAQAWQALAENRQLLNVNDAGRRWVADHADYKDLAVQYDQLLRGLLAHGPSAASGRKTTRPMRHTTRRPGDTGRAKPH